MYDFPCNEMGEIKRLFQLQRYNKHGLKWSVQVSYKVYILTKHWQEVTCLKYFSCILMSFAKYLFLSNQIPLNTSNYYFLAVVVYILWCLETDSKNIKLVFLIRHHWLLQSQVKWKYKKWEYKLNDKTESKLLLLGVKLRYHIFFTVTA